MPLLDGWSHIIPKLTQWLSQFSAGLLGECSYSSNDIVVQWLIVRNFYILPALAMFVWWYRWEPGPRRLPDLTTTRTGIQSKNLGGNAAPQGQDSSILTSLPTDPWTISPQTARLQDRIATDIPSQSNPSENGLTQSKAQSPKPATLQEITADQTTTAPDNESILANTDSSGSSSEAPPTTKVSEPQGGSLLLHKPSTNPTSQLTDPQNRSVTKHAPINVEDASAIDPTLPNLAKVLTKPHSRK